MKPVTDVPIGRRIWISQSQQGACCPIPFERRNSLQVPHVFLNHSSACCRGSTCLSSNLRTFSPLSVTACPNPAATKNSLPPGASIIAFFTDVLLIRSVLYLVSFLLSMILRKTLTSVASSVCRDCPELSNNLRAHFSQTLSSLSVGSICMRWYSVVRPLIRVLNKPRISKTRRCLRRELTVTRNSESPQNVTRNVRCWRSNFAVGFSNFQTVQI
jgi:hypothetical protein